MFVFNIMPNSHVVDEFYPRPTPPWINKGLYDFPGLEATPIAADFTNWLEGPSIKWLKVYP